MKVLLTTLNAKYNHSAPSLFILEAYARDAAKSGGHSLEVVEYTINQKQNFILRSVIESRPEVICFSCYIWNIRQTMELAKILKQILPHVIIVTGGPEVTYTSEKFLEDNPCIDIVVRKEGEATLAELLEQNFSSLKNIKGITYRSHDKEVYNPDRPELPIDSVPFIYTEDNIHYFKDKHIYYETSRGCPFCCGYCLSSADQIMRFIPLNRAIAELDFFLAHGDIVKRVKLLDRTFNCRRNHAIPIWRHLIEYDNGVTNFHFEIDAGLLDDESIELLALSRPGQFQFEIGIQSTHGKTLDAISRKKDFARCSHFIRLLSKNRNIHLHLDLIAGLPFEDMKSFGKSFDDVYGLKPDQLQLGFLKILKGTALYNHADEHGIVYKNEAPYEVLFTNDMTYHDISFLHIVEMLLETYYNAGQARYTLSYMEQFFDSEFVMYTCFAEFYLNNGYHKCDHNRVEQMHILYLFCEKHVESTDFWLVAELIKLDLLLKDNLKNPPPWFGRIPIQGKSGKMTHREAFEFERGAAPVILEFDYINRDIITGYAQTAMDKIPEAIRELSGAQ